MVAVVGLMSRLGRLKVWSFSDVFHMVVCNQNVDHVD